MLLNLSWFFLYAMHANRLIGAINFYMCIFSSSRFDSMISFGLPDQQTREEIAVQYAKHLKKSELVQFASATEE